MWVNFAEKNCFPIQLKANDNCFVSQGVPRISSDGDYRMGVKIKTPRKALGLPTQPIPGQQINPPRIPCTHAKFPSLNNLGWFLFAELWARDLRALQRISDCYKSSQPKKALAKFSYPKKARNQKFQTPKYPLIIPATWNPEYLPPTPASTVCKSDKQGWAVHSGPQELFSIAHNYGRAQP